jgi:hypothetical protein
MAVPDHQLHANKGKKKDDREWTTDNEKTYLESKQAEFRAAKVHNGLPAWYFTELKKYFLLFPTKGVTKRELMDHPKWTLDHKKASEVIVSDSRLS